MEQVILAPGRYVVAVSGGIDSMCLLHAMADRPGVELVVAHFNHRVRMDAAEDAQLVARTAKTYGLAVHLGEAADGLGHDEASLRFARYAFLRLTMKTVGATAIITAHHQDDLLETIILQLSRGSGRRGLTPFETSDDIIRPLLTVTKQHIRDYAAAHGIEWREDSTNTDTVYARNALRQRLTETLDARSRQRLLSLYQANRPINKMIDDILTAISVPCRREFIGWPHSVSCEYLASWLRGQGIISFDRLLLERVTVALKTLPPGKRIDLLGGYFITTGSISLALKPVERYNKETYG